jgi:hypothetical protein
MNGAKVGNQFHASQLLLARETETTYTVEKFELKIDQTGWCTDCSAVAFNIMCL